MAACWPLQMPPTPKAVLISLADNANDHGECWPSIPKICERTCFGERTVHHAIRWLEEHGAVRADRSNGRHTRYEVTPNTYEPPQELRPRNTCAPATAAAKPPQLTAQPPQQRQSPPQELRSNRKEPSLKATKSKSRSPAATLPDPPDWIDPKAWAGFVEMRKRIGFPLTAYAAELILAELARHRDAGADPNASLNKSTRNGWRDVFPPKDGTHAAPRKLSLCERALEGAIAGERRDRAQRHEHADALAADDGVLRPQVGFDVR